MPDEPKPKANGVKLGERLANLKRLAREYKAKLKAAETERDELKAKPTADDVVKERDQLKGQIRSDKHKAAFRQAAKDAKVREDALDDLWELAKLDTTADEPDPKEIAAAIGDKVKARPYLVSDGSSTTEEKPLSKGPGAERGGRTQSAGMTVKYSDLADGVWVRENQDRLRAAQAEGTVTYVD